MKEKMMQAAAWTVAAVMCGACCCLEKAGVTETVTEKTGAAIQRAIDRVAAAGGGRVIVPAGVYPSGSIRLRSHVDLHLEKDAVVRGGTKSEDYASFPEEVCAIKPENSTKVFLYAWDESDFAITGEGRFDGQGLAFFDTSSLKMGGRFFAKPPIERPRMVQLIRCRDFRFEGVTFWNSPCWTMLIRQCENILFDGIRVMADLRIINSDGVDFETCRHVRVRNCTFRTGDDCFAIRAIRDDGSDEPAVTEDVLVEDCTLCSACQTIRMGCPSDDEIRDVTFRNIRATGNNGINFDYPARYLHPGNDGFMNIHDITFENFSGTFLARALRICTESGVKIRGVRDITFRNLNVTSAFPTQFKGNVYSKLERIRFDNVTVNDERQPDGFQPVDCTDAGPLKRIDGWSWETRKTSVGNKGTDSKKK